MLARAFAAEVPAEWVVGDTVYGYDEVRTWRAWYRYVTLALLAYAALVVMQGQARAQEKKAEALGSGLN
jgi:SRSO17 transposase